LGEREDVREGGRVGGREGRRGGRRGIPVFQALKVVMLPQSQVVMAT
jgi:hypothetical protein